MPRPSIGSRIRRVLADLGRLAAEGAPKARALEPMVQRTGWSDPHLVPGNQDAKQAWDEPTWNDSDFRESPRQSGPHLSESRTTHHTMKTHVLWAVTAGAALVGTSAHGQFAWAHRIASTVNPSDELAIGLALDARGNCHVTGWFDGANDFGGVVLTSQTPGGQDIFVAKYDPAGALLWVRQAGGPTPAWNMGRGVGTDLIGNVYVTGGFSGDVTFGTTVVSALEATEFFLAKYDKTGVIQWVRQSVGGHGDGVYGTGLAVDSAGNSYAVGFADNGLTVTFGSTNLLSPSPTGYSSFLVKYDAAGTLQWAQLLGGPGHTYATKVAADAAGNVYVHGGFTEDTTMGGRHLVSTGDADAFIAKFDAAGTLAWVQQAGGPGKENEGGIAVDSAGRVLVTGQFGSDPMTISGLTLTNAGGWDAYLAQYDASGGLQWARRAGGAGLDGYFDVALDQQNFAYAAGASGSDALPPSSQGGALVARYDPAGNLLWAQSASSPPADPVGSFVAKCAVDAGGNTFLAGWYQGTATFGASTLEPQGHWNLFLARVPDPMVALFPHRTNNANVTVTGYVGPGGAVTVPATLSGLPVLRIGDSAFRDNTSLTAITIPEGVVRIEFNAFFGCRSLTNVSLPNSLTNIADHAFRECSRLPGIALGSGLLSIGTAAFYSCGSLTHLTIPDGVLTIGDSAFFYCTNLASATLGANVTNVGSRAFAGCKSLTSVRIGPRVANLGDLAFVSCDNLDSITVDPLNAFYSSADGVLFNKSQTTLLQCPGAKAGSYAIPNTVTRLGDYAFGPCARLTEVTMPPSVTRMGTGAFYGCSSLAKAAIPDGVTAIADQAFYACFQLASVTIPQGATAIGKEAFAHCTRLGNITVPAAVTNLANSAFAYCTSLAGAFFQGDAPNLGSSVFDGDNAATVYYLPGTAGWGPTLGGRPTRMWNPVIQTGSPIFGVQANGFGFEITGPTGIPFIVEAATNLTHPVWWPLQSGSLAGGSHYFSDPEWANHPARFYRLRSP